MQPVPQVDVTDPFPVIWTATSMTSYGLYRITNLVEKVTRFVVSIIGKTPEWADSIIGDMGTYARVFVVFDWSPQLRWLGGNRTWQSTANLVCFSAGQFLCVIAAFKKVVDVGAFVSRLVARIPYLRVFANVSLISVAFFGDDCTALWDASAKMHKLRKEEANARAANAANPGNVVPNANTPHVINGVALSKSQFDQRIASEKIAKWELRREAWNAIVAGGPTLTPQLAALRNQYAAWVNNNTPSSLTPADAVAYRQAKMVKWNIYIAEMTARRNSNSANGPAMFDVFRSTIVTAQLPGPNGQPQNVLQVAPAMDTVPARPAKYFTSKFEWHIKDWSLKKIAEDKRKVKLGLAIANDAMKVAMAIAVPAGLVFGISFLAASTVLMSGLSLFVSAFSLARVLYSYDSKASRPDIVKNNSYSTRYQMLSNVPLV